MTSMEALVAYRNGSYKQLTYERLIEAVDALNRKIGSIETMFRQKGIEPLPELQNDLRNYRDAKDGIVNQITRTTNLDTF